MGKMVLGPDYEMRSEIKVRTLASSFSPKLGQYSITDELRETKERFFYKRSDYSIRLILCDTLFFCILKRMSSYFN